jgi:hypothetical protein
MPRVKDNKKEGRILYNLEKNKLLEYRNHRDINEAKLTEKMK